MEYDLADTYQNWIDKKNKGEQAEDVFDSMFCGFFNYVGDDPQYWPLDIDFMSRYYNGKLTAELKHDMTAATSGRFYLEWTTNKPSHDGKGCIQYSKATYLCLSAPIKPFSQLYVFKLADIQRLCRDKKLQSGYTQWGSCYWLPIADIPTLGVEYRQYHFNGKPHFFEIF